jgi:leukotriene-A4 hydrolase
MAATNVNKQVDVDFTTPRDPNTLSNYHNFVTRHTSVDFEIDFEKRILSGAVELEFESLTDDHVAQIVLDSRCVCCGGALARKLFMN